jgi:hypothetical protein
MNHKNGTQKFLLWVFNLPFAFAAILRNPHLLFLQEKKQLIAGSNQHKKAFWGFLLYIPEYLTPPIPI